MKLIVDASIAVKWLFTEPHSHESRRLLAPRIDLDAPDFILTEVANVIWKKARRKDIPSPTPYIKELANLKDAVALQPSTELVIKAAALAAQIDCSVYVCLYLARADRLKDCAVTFPDPLTIQGKYLFKPPLRFAPGGEAAEDVKRWLPTSRESGKAIPRSPAC